MKSGSGESPKLLGTGPGSAEIHDFLYVDRARISALYAQLFPQGVLTSVKTTAHQSFSDEGNVGTDVKVFKAETKSIEGGVEGVEHSFDASWSIPLDVLDELKKRSLVRSSLQGAGLGSIIQADCLLRVIDFASMANLWEPGMKMFLAGGAQPSPGMTDAMVPTIAEAMKALPYAIHAHYLTNEAKLWSSLRPENLTIPTSDLTLKYGGEVSGLWKLLYLLDAWPDMGAAPNVDIWSAGVVMDNVLTAIHALKTGFGRPAGWSGITPLMIYRSIEGWIPQSSNAPSQDSLTKKE